MKKRTHIVFQYSKSGKVVFSTEPMYLSLLQHLGDYIHCATLLGLRLTVFYISKHGICDSCKGSGMLILQNGVIRQPIRCEYCNGEGKI